MPIPHDLVEAIRQGKCAMFVGAGASVGAGLPSWSELVQTIAKRLDPSVEPDLLGGRYSLELMQRIPSYFVNQAQQNRRSLYELLETLFTPLPRTRTSTHDLIAQLPVELFYTTNFDPLLEGALQRQGRQPLVIAGEEQACQRPARDKCQVRKLHGSTPGNWANIILTKEDYASAVASRPVFFQSLSDDLRTRQFLFFGYSARDPDFEMVYEAVLQTMGGYTQTHYFVTASTLNSHEQLYLTRKGFRPISLQEFGSGPDEDRSLQFLTELVEQTSEAYHLKKFFADFPETTQIVVKSEEHAEHYLAYPACDVTAAQCIGNLLGVIDIKAEILSAHGAIEKAAALEQQNLVLVCSPLGSAFTAHVFEKHLASGGQLPPKFSQRDGSRVVEVGEQSFACSAATIPGEAVNDVVVIGRYPYNSDHPEIIVSDPIYF